MGEAQRSRQRAQAWSSSILDNLCLIDQYLRIAKVALISVRKPLLFEVEVSVLITDVYPSDLSWSLRWLREESKEDRYRMRVVILSLTWLLDICWPPLNLFTILFSNIFMYSSLIHYFPTAVSSHPTLSSSSLPSLSPRSTSYFFNIERLKISLLNFVVLFYF